MVLNQNHPFKLKYWNFILLHVSILFKSIGKREGMKLAVLCWDKAPCPPPIDSIATTVLVGSRYSPFPPQGEAFCTDTTQLANIKPCNSLEYHFQVIKLLFSLNLTSQWGHCESLEDLYGLFHHFNLIKIT